MSVWREHLRMSIFTWSAPKTAFPASCAPVNQCMSDLEIAKCIFAIEKLFRCIDLTTYKYVDDVRSGFPAKDAS